MYIRGLKSLAEAKPGQVVSFAYYGGSNVGAVREVRVTEVLDDRIVGIDLAKDGLRQYLFDNAALVKLISDVQLEPSTVVKPGIRTQRISFDHARQVLYQHIDSLTAEELAEVTAEVCGANHGSFDSATHEVILETEAVVPHCELNDHAHRDAAGLDWVNQNGDRLTTTFFHDSDNVRFFCGNDETDAESIIKMIAEHFGL